MNKENLLARLSLLMHQYEEQKHMATQAHNTLMAFDGAIQECNYWLSMFSEEIEIKEKRNSEKKKNRKEKNENIIDPLEDEK